VPRSLRRHGQRHDHPGITDGDTRRERSLGATFFAGAAFGAPYQTLTLNDVTVTGGSDAGIVLYHWNLTMTDSTVTGNAGSGIRARDFFSPGALVRLTRTTVSDNTSDRSGGGIADSEFGTITLTRTTVTANSAGGSGGGISCSVAMTDSTVSGNTTPNAGGGVAGSGTFADSEITGNSAGAAGGCAFVGTFTD
jgi:predicted outer membrane repeat protein